MRRSLAVALLALVALSGSARATTTGATETDVLALDDFFLPSIASVPRGGTVVWRFAEADRSHTVSDSSGMALFDSGFVAPGGPSMTYRFTAAGTYPYTCTLHALVMNGRVEVPVRVAPSNARVGSTIRVRWATDPASEGFVYDVRLKSTGGSWVTWMSGVTEPNATFVPEDAGTFRFRARLRATSGAHAAWSPSASASVT